MKKRKKQQNIEKADKTGFNALASLAAATLGTGTVFYHFIENWGWIDSLYFSVITLTTVGYGDFTPTTQLSKIFTIVYVMIGISIMLGFINLVARRRFWKTEK